MFKLQVLQPNVQCETPFKLRWEENRVFLWETDYCQSGYLELPLNGKWLFKSVVPPHGDLKIIMF